MTGSARIGRSLSLAAGLGALCSVASGYYNFVYFAGRNAPFTPIPVKFQVNAVSYFISDQPPSVMMPGDSYAGIVSQIRSAAAVWNGVQSSTLRLSYGGVSTVGTPQSAPGIDVVFDDNMPPGLLAQTRVTTPDDVSFLASGAVGSVPLLRSKVQLRSDLTAVVGAVNGQPSYSELFYTTLVHEFGHALGLQHSLVSGTMATQVTRATTKGNPLAADDIAAVSQLYPTAAYVGSTGSITGRVTLNGGGVNLASVVALSTTGAVVSALTNPDGSYAINGIPQGQYYVYVHPLPPAQQGEAYPDNIVPPVDSQKNPFPAQTGFVTQFYSGTTGGTRNWTQATQFQINRGATQANVNFAVQASAGPAVYNLQTYEYQGSAKVPVPSPYVTVGDREYLVFTANGALVNGTTQMTPGLSVSTIGAAARLEPATLAYYQQGFLYEVLDAGPLPAGVSTAPVALAVTTNTDLYVLPAAVTVAYSAPPAVSSVNGSTDGLGNTAATVAGANFSLGAAGTPGTQILFDGAPATVLQQNSDGSLTVSAPAAASYAAANYAAFVEAVNPDGQSSAQALAGPPPTFTYAPNNPSFAVNNSGPLAAGANQAVQITGINTNFNGPTAGLGTVVGFGSSDIQVLQVLVVDATHLMANIAVSPLATPGSVTVSVDNGLQLETLPGVVQVQTANPQTISLLAPVVSQPTGGGYNAVIGIAGQLPASAITPPPQQTLASGWSLTIGGVQAQPVAVLSSTQISAPVPSKLSGPQLIQLVGPTGAIPPIAMQVDAAPPVIEPIDPSHTYGVGDLVTLTVDQLGADPNVAVAPTSVSVVVGGVSQPVGQVAQRGTSNSYSVQFNMAAGTPLTPTGDSVVVSVGARQSAPATIYLHN